MDNKIKAVCALVIDTSGNILSVTRKTDHSDWGLPGGKLDAGESYLQGLVRETLEETGLTIEPINLDYYEAVDSDYIVRTYICKITNIKMVPTSKQESGLVEFKKPIELLKSSFKDYNLNCFLFFHIILDFESIKDLFKDIRRHFSISVEDQAKLLKDSLNYYTPISKELNITITELVDTDYLQYFLKYYNLIAHFESITVIDVELNWNFGTIKYITEVNTVNLIFYSTKCEFEINNKLLNVNFIDGSINLKVIEDCNIIETKFKSILNLLGT